MKKHLVIIVFILFSVLSYSQQITFQKNTNIKANVLLQKLNKNQDSLILESKSDLISKVDIFSDNYSKHIDVNRIKIKIDLKNLPFGNFVIQAKVDQKWIVMYLEKNKMNVITANDSNQLNSSGRSDKENLKNNPVFCWVVSERNSNSGSSKTMKLEYKKKVDKLISKNKLELKSNVGKNNKLHIYIVYNKSEFMNKQLRNPNYYKSVEESKLFNTNPYYTSNKEKENDSSS